jgi:hypothetical protein
MPGTTDDFIAGAGCPMDACFLEGIKLFLRIYPLFIHKNPGSEQIDFLQSLGVCNALENHRDWVYPKLESGACLRERIFVPQGFCFPMIGLTE